MINDFLDLKILLEYIRDIYGYPIIIRKNPSIITRDIYGYPFIFLAKI